MLNLLVTWFIGALALWLVSRILAGIRVRSFSTALAAAAVIAVVNAVIGPILRFLTFPLTILTLGLFLLVINAALLKLSSMFVPGFEVKGFLNALIGSVLLTVLNAIFRHVVFS